MHPAVAQTIVAFSLDLGSLAVYAHFPPDCAALYPLGVAQSDGKKGFLGGIASLQTSLHNGDCPTPVNWG